MTTEVETTETQQTTETTSMEVDLFGIKVALPLEQAKQVIQKRDERVKNYKELESNYQTTSKKLLEATEKSKLVESDYEKVKSDIETRIKTEYEDVLTSYKTKLIHSAIDSAILSNDNIVEDKAAREDLKQLFLATNKDIATDNLQEALVEFVKEKPHFLRASKELAKPPVQKSKLTPPSPTLGKDEYFKKLFKL